MPSGIDRRKMPVPGSTVCLPYALSIDMRLEASRRRQEVLNFKPRRANKVFSSSRLHTDIQLAVADSYHTGAILSTGPSRSSVILLLHFCHRGKSGGSVPNSDDRWCFRGLTWVSIEGCVFLDALPRIPWD